MVENMMMSLSRNIQKPKPATTRGDAGPRCDIGMSPAREDCTGAHWHCFGRAHDACLAAERDCSYRLISLAGTSTSPLVRQA